MAGLIVHEWIEKAGGAERVLDAFADEYPNAPISVLWTDARDRFDNDRVRESWLAATPLRRNKAAALPFMLPTWRARSAKAEWILVSSHLFAHHIRVSPSTPKLVYAHTPARYIWEPDVDQRGASIVARAASRFLRPIDRRRAAEATAIAANSEFTRARIARTWERDSVVIYPPVRTITLTETADFLNDLTSSETATLDSLPSDFLLGASRMVTYKRLDDVIRVGRETRTPVVLAGSGPERNRLASLAEDISATVYFVDEPSDRLLQALYSRARALVFPAVEDFGIMPVEAMAAGTPVIGNCLGGVAESIRLCQGGIAIDFDVAQDWDQVLCQIEGTDVRAMRARTRQFDESVFRSNIRDWVGSHINKGETLAHG